MKSTLTFIVSLGILIMFVTAQAAQASTYKAMKQGAESYKQGNYDDSLSRFQEAAVESPDDPGVRFNLASAQYQAGKFDEAAVGFESVISRAADPALKQKSLYNLGNTAFRQGNMQASADYYRKALDLNPSDLEAKQNLEFVLKEQQKKQQNPKKNDQDQKGDKKDKEQQQNGQQNKQQDKDRNQQQSSKRQPSSNQQKEKQKNGDASPQASQNQEQKNESGEIKEAGSGGEQKQAERREGSQAGKPSGPPAIAPEEAERLLNTLSDDQRAFIREQAKRVAPQTRGTTKDW